MANDMKNLTDPSRDMTCESSSLDVRDSPVGRKDIPKITLSIISISINLIAVGMLSYALYLISHNSHIPQTFSLVERGNNDFTPLQMMAMVDVNKVPTDANVLLEIKDNDAITVRLYQIKSVQAKLDNDQQELTRTFYLSMNHALTFKKGSGTAVLYDESTSSVLAEYDLDSRKGIKLAEMEGAKEVELPKDKTKGLRNLFFIKEKSHMMKKPYGPPPPPPFYGPYNPYCAYCGMYSYGARPPFGGGFPYGGGGFGWY